MFESDPPVFFFYYTRSFIVLIEMHSGAHTHIQYFQRKTRGYSFLIDPKLIETSPFIDGLNRLVYALLSSKTMSFSS